MKKLVLLAMLVLAAQQAFSQGSATVNDIIVMADGTFVQAKVTKITDETLTFNYPGEALINEVKLDKLERVVFASGRTQFFGDKQSPNSGQIDQMAVQEPQPTSGEDVYLLPVQNQMKKALFEENTLAVLPITFMKNDTYDETLSMAATGHVMQLIDQGASQKGITVQDMGTTVSKLIDSGISFNDLDNAPVDKLRKTIGTEYILRVNVDQKTTSAKKAMGWAALHSESNDTPDNDLTANISLQLFDAENVSESYEVDFSEGLSVRDKRNLGSAARWRSSLDYVLRQLMDSGSLQ